MTQLVPITDAYPGWVFVIQRTEGNTLEDFWVVTNGEDSAWNFLKALQDRQRVIDTQRDGKNAYGELLSAQPAWHNCFRMWAVLSDIDNFTHERIGKASRGAPQILLYGYSPTLIMVNRRLSAALEEVRNAAGCGIVAEMADA